VARIFVFALIATAAVAAIAVVMRRRSASSLDYEVYPPFEDYDSNFGAETPLDDDGFHLPREDAYSQYGARTYN
jgi:hypothetical protein